MVVEEAAKALAGILRGGHENMRYSEAFSVCLRATQADPEALTQAVRDELGDDAALVDMPAEQTGPAKE